MPTIDLARGPVEYTVLDGDPAAAPLVFLHEGLGCVAMWRRFPARLAAVTGRRALVFSRHGYGGSGPARLPRSPRYLHEEAQEVLPELLDRLGMRRPVLVGHSDGASIALLHAAAHPVEAAVAMAPHLFVEKETLQGIEAARTSYDAGILARELAFYHQDPRTVFDSWSRVWLSPGFRDWNIEDDLATVTAPVLLVQGDRDQYGTTAHLDAAERAVSGPVRRLEPAGCGHTPHLERPDDVIEAVRTFLAELPGLSEPPGPGTRPPHQEARP
ncbi:alpha/beta hydrolase [Streptomyces sp. NPDC046215]|uniref:Alpha/beta hydrolase n=1 Tax=Streptomyces stramineus TaxID=173861 RepID=A0ABN1B0Z2_9ACTN